MSLDPFVLTTGEPFSYAQDDPTNKTDPTGQFVDDCGNDGDPIDTGECDVGDGLEGIGDAVPYIARAAIEAAYAQWETYWQLWDWEWNLVKQGWDYVFGGGSSSEPPVEKIDGLPLLIISEQRMPNIAIHVQQAINSGYPSVLTHADQATQNRNRRAACGGWTGPGSCDEYPFASTYQGGVGASTAGVPIQEQYIEGGVIGSFYRWTPVPIGRSFLVATDVANLRSTTLPPAGGSDLPCYSGAGSGTSLD